MLPIERVGAPRLFPRRLTTFAGVYIKVAQVHFMTPAPPSIYIKERISRTLDPSQLYTFLSIIICICAECTHTWLKYIHYTSWVMSSKWPCSCYIMSISTCTHTHSAPLMSNLSWLCLFMLHLTNRELFVFAYCKKLFWGSPNVELINKRAPQGQDHYVVN